MSKKKCYAVLRGRRVGIFHTWDECFQQVYKFHNAKFKGFATLALAELYMKQESDPSSVTCSVVPQSTPFAAFSSSQKIFLGSDNQDINPYTSYERPKVPCKRAADDVTKTRTEVPKYSAASQKMVAKMGFVEGKGLGKELQGMAAPVEAWLWKREAERETKASAGNCKTGK